MEKVGLFVSEPLRTTVAGIGKRYLDIARLLAKEGFKVVLSAPSISVEEIEGVEYRTYRKEYIGSLFQDVNSLLVQGYLATEILNIYNGLPIAVDLYDPYIVENLEYIHEIGSRIYHDDLERLKTQLAMGDFFLIAHRNQKIFYFAMLMVLGRVSPDLYLQDPSFDTIFGEIPSSPPADLPPYRPLLGYSVPQPRILFGSLYPWYDPFPVIEAVVNYDLGSLIFINSPHPDTTPLGIYESVKNRYKSFIDRKIFFIDSLEYSKVLNLLREVDLLITIGKREIETLLSFRTRYLDALAVGCPVIIEEGSILAYEIEKANAGIVITSKEVRDVKEALVKVLQNKELARKYAENGKRLVRKWLLTDTIKPLVNFFKNPRKLSRCINPIYKEKYLLSVANRVLSLFGKR